MNTENFLKSIKDISKKQIRASAILGKPVCPRAYVPYEVTEEMKKIVAEKAGIDPQTLIDTLPVAEIPLTDRDLNKSLLALGSTISSLEISKIVLVCDMEVEGNISALSISLIDLKEQDTTIAIPYYIKGEEVIFGNEDVRHASFDSLRDPILSGFFLSKGSTFIHKEGDRDVDEYIESFLTEFPNIEGKNNVEVL